MAIGITTLENETWFRIDHCDAMRPFLMSIVSGSDHWMFIASNGGLTAGRKNADHALFPYYTDDKLVELAETTGSKTIIRVEKDEDVQVWEPFSDRFANRYNTSRNLYKNKFGNKVMFEEINHDLNLSFCYQWNTGDRFGFIKKAKLVNHSGHNRRVRVLDGIQNVMPHGVPSDLQMTTSNLADAYKRSELVAETGLGIFALSAIIVDKAEPSEALKANIAWSWGLKRPVYLLSALQLDQFRKGQPLQTELDVKGERGAYFVCADLNLQADSEHQWYIVADINQNHAQIIELNHRIQHQSTSPGQIQADIDQNTRNLLLLVAGADGMQRSADPMQDARHYSNVLFNILRGGVFDKDYQIEKADFSTYLSGANKAVFERNQRFLNQLTTRFDRSALEAALDGCEDHDLVRLCTEYLPLKFSRRHGDPSRPWNKFSINTRNELDGSPILDYEGNWRDIFQNWEALAHAYPGFVEGMIFKFLNATTFDGYNPYRVTKAGFDWETVEPDNPWSYIGYWGDHQIVYLLKLLEFLDQHDAAALAQWLGHEYFVYANVPYRIKPYSKIVEDPKNTIDFDEAADHRIRASMAARGADGALLGSATNDIHRVNFAEKVLATVLAKISNFIPEAGIWMNTQRPEWNDANNALVGNGVSMVTLFYLRRFLKLLERTTGSSDIDHLYISSELLAYFNAITTTLDTHAEGLSGKITDGQRKALTDELGTASSNYRENIYANGFSGTKSAFPLAHFNRFVQTALRHIEQSIEANKRANGLYHAYNLVSTNKDGMSIGHLDEMLEAQVAAISSGCLSPENVLQLLDAMRRGPLYRADQNSYLLYPNKTLPRFLDKNNIPAATLEKSRLLRQLVSDLNLQIVVPDIAGGYHFNGNFKNANDLNVALDTLPATRYAALVEAERAAVSGIFEELFNHKAFTGRSGTFFAYEGLGSIYWHMVSKLHLAVQEACFHAIETRADKATLERLLTHYHEIGEGIGIHKSPTQYGAFPTDPYSHTPQHRGAQQPGMTGQVKEDILVRIGTLGVAVREGLLHFSPRLLRRSELLSKPATFEYFNLQNEVQKLALKPGTLGFTYCQTPVVYQLAAQEGLEICFSDGSVQHSQTLIIERETSRLIFQRSGTVKQITVFLNETSFRA